MTLLVGARTVLVGVLLVVGELFAEPRQGQPAAGPAGSATYESGKGPVVAFDEAHSNVGVSPYPQTIELLKADGYRPRSLTQKMSAASLADADVLFIANPGETVAIALARIYGGQPPNQEQIVATQSASLSDDEIAAVVAWLKGGGSLLLVVGHEPYPLAAAKFTAALGVPNWPNGSAGVRTDLCTRGPDGRRAIPACTAGGIVQGIIFWRADFFPGGEPAFAEIEGSRQPAKAYQSADAILAKHPITEGRSPAERIRHVVIGGSPSAFQAPPGSEPLLTLPRDAMLGTKPIGGWLEGAVMQVGKGRLAAFTNSALIQGGPAADNRQFVLNVMHWLSHLL